jgi:hypothetical protein
LPGMSADTARIRSTRAVIAFLRQAAQDHPRLSCTTAPGVSRFQDASPHVNYMIRSVTKNAAQLAQIKPPPTAHTHNLAT